MTLAQAFALYGAVQLVLALALGEVLTRVVDRALEEDGSDEP